MKIKPIIFATIAALAMGASAAQATVLDFDTLGACSSASNGNGSVVACGDWSAISQAYGDVAGVVDVQYSAPRIPGSSLQWWSASYNTLHGIVFAPGGNDNSKARIDLVSLNGQAVTLSHFDLGAYSNTTRNTKITISDLSGHVLMNYAGTVGNDHPNSPSSFNGSWTGASGIRIEWEDNAYNVGIDNITYSMAPVPEPETYAMLIAGLAALGVVARRRKA